MLERAGLLLAGVAVTVYALARVAGRADAIDHWQRKAERDAEEAP